METTARLYTLPFNNIKTYVAAALFITGNIALPQLFHLVPQGGIIWLPIYFFTLIGAYKYGWRVGIITALASPLANTLLFGMPAMAALPAIMLKSVILATLAGFTAQRFQKVSLVLLIAVVLGYQVLGTIGEWILNGDFMLACQDFRLGIPGMLLQIAGGRLIINAKSDIKK